MKTEKLKAKPDKPPGIPTTGLSLFQLKYTGLEVVALVNDKISVH